MAWSTKQLAELAGTSLRAVRHYHDVGLLSEPERRANGYKQYGVAHLVRLLRIKRLVDLGFSLTQIAEMDDDEDHPEQALRTLDAELAATIERLQRARVELATILDRSGSADLPAELSDVSQTARFSAADRSFSVVLSRVLGSQGLQTYADLVRDTPDDPAFGEFDELSADADESVRQALAERMAGPLAALRAAHPPLAFGGDAPIDARRAQQTVGAALRELYNGAQIDVLVRIETEIAKQAPAG
ncbi:transcriptional regulator, MerR family protein [Actinomycetospora sp. NBRC 106375]|uniref:MerR family transcriptional regulator n=1 Tax=Actinomycetospora sp. NBRC 106375 TaxID=3032207 RepID=UPI0024A4BCF7|nr:MerR family transcriptional regulator [Actinomycetospora sp. NBRC 106375]GLZ47490.1 transcriptional regulator, MerR family protein [Actinomycetospora sp. NBRC 106375]